MRNDGKPLMRMINEANKLYESLGILCWHFDLQTGSVKMVGSGANTRMIKMRVPGDFIACTGPYAKVGRGISVLLECKSRLDFFKQGSGIGWKATASLGSLPTGGKGGQREHLTRHAKGGLSFVILESGYPWKDDGAVIEQFAVPWATEADLKRKPIEWYEQWRIPVRRGVLDYLGELQ